MTVRHPVLGSFLLAAAVLSGCRAPDPDPTVLVRTPGGVELGVSTAHGVVFLGRHATGGEADVVSFFGDGPNIEPCLIEKLGGGLYALDMEIELPSVAVAFELPPEGAALEIRGRDANGPWSRVVRRARGVQVDGLVLELPDEALPPDCAGAGVFVRDARGRLRVLGLLAGRALVETPAGERDLLCTIGPLDLWRIVTFERNRHRARPAVYREDLR